MASDGISEILVPTNFTSNATVNATTTWSPAQVQDTCRLESEAHDIFVFVFLAFLVGTAIKSFSMLPPFRNMQDTVIIFFLGVVFSVGQEKMKLYLNTGPIGVSHCVWMGLSVRVLHFATLPALLTGDAFAIDTAVARQVAKRVVFLAGPGSLFCSLLNALFLYGYIPHGWSFALCVAVGSILTATHSKAVIYILKELGAPPNLRVLIQGEALLNDGIALVLFNAAYAAIGGAAWSFDDIPFFLLKVVMGAAVLGTAMGTLATHWMRLTCKRLEHDSPLIQVFVTILCAYWSYIIAETFLGVSGVLATVTASLVLADKMWPVVVQAELIHQAWHIFEYVSNACIFFIAGALCGHAMLIIQMQDYIHCVVIYVVSTIVRFLMLLLSTPALRVLNADRELVPVQDMAVMCWSSMQGAVGLSLAIQVSVNQGGGRLNFIDAQRVLFYTGGIAALTLVFNCHTCTALVKRLGIVGTSKTKLQLMLTMHMQLDHEARQFAAASGGQSAFLDELGHAVGSILDGMVKDVERTIMASRLAGGVVPICHASTINSSVRESDLVALHRQARESYRRIPKETLTLLRLPDVPVREDLLENYMSLASERPSRDRLRAVNEAFFHWLREYYHAYTRDGDCVEDDFTVHLLLNSVGYGLEYAAFMINDLAHIAKQLMKSEDQYLAEIGRIGVSYLAKEAPARTISFMGKTSTQQQRAVELEEVANRKLGRLNTIMVVVVISHLLWVSCEFLAQAEFVANMGDLAVLLIDAAFEAMFFTEFIQRLKVWGKDYLQSTANIMDLSLLLICILGTTTELSIRLAGHGVHVEWMRLVRLVRVLRAFWALNIAWRFAMQLKAHPVLNCPAMNWLFGTPDPNIKRMQYLCALICFVQAHAACRDKLLAHFSWNHKAEMCEEARCIMESQIEMFIASIMAFHLAELLDDSALECQFVLKESNIITGKLARHVLRAHAAGLLGVTETESLLLPMRDRIGMMDRRMRRAVRHSRARPGSRTSEQLQPGAESLGRKEDEAFSHGDSETPSGKHAGETDLEAEGPGPRRGGAAAGPSNQHGPSDKHSPSDRHCLPSGVLPIGTATGSAPTASDEVHLTNNNCRRQHPQHLEGEYAGSTRPVPPAVHEHPQPPHRIPQNNSSGPTSEVRVMEADQQSQPLPRSMPTPPTSMEEGIKGAGPPPDSLDSRIQALSQEADREAAELIQAAKRSQNRPQIAPQATRRQQPVLAQAVHRKPLRSVHGQPEIPTPPSSLPTSPR